MNGTCEHCGASAPLMLSPVHRQARCFRCAALKPGEPPSVPDTFKHCPDAALIVQLCVAESDRLMEEIQRRAVQERGKATDKELAAYVEGARVGTRSVYKMMEMKARALARDREVAT